MGHYKEKIMSEILWKDVEGYEGYYKISEEGDVFSIRSNRNLTPDRDSDGYLIYTLSLNGNIKKMKAHRLVALAFLDNVNNLPQVNHKNAVKDNNHVSNLEWCSAIENTQHYIKLGLKTIKTGEDCSYAKLNNLSVEEIKEDILSGMRYIDIAEKHNISPATISMINTGQRWGDTPLKTVKTHNIGSENPASKLSEEEVKEIFECLKRGEQQIDVAKKFSVAKGLISDIARRKVWTHVETDYVYAPKKARLSEEDIIQITEYSKNRTYTRLQIAQKYGVSKALIDKVLKQ